MARAWEVELMPAMNIIRLPTEAVRRQANMPGLRPRASENCEGVLDGKWWEGGDGGRGGLGWSG